MRSPPSRQRDLFEVDQKMLDIPNTQKPLLVSVIERMLVEAQPTTTRHMRLTIRQRRSLMSKITSEHLSRQAVVYIRQSTADQVANNLESKRRQYGLADRAQQLGWNDVAIIDDDLGRSGGGVARPGFEKLLAAIFTSLNMVLGQPIY